MIETEETLRGDTRWEAALGQIVQAVEAQFSAQPYRQKAFAVAVGSNSVDVVVASKTDHGIVTYQHSGQQLLYLSRDSPGLQALVAAATASVEACGRQNHDTASASADELRVCRCTRAAESGQGSSRGSNGQWHSSVPSQDKEAHARKHTERRASNPQDLPISADSYRGAPLYRLRHLGQRCL